MRKVAYQGVRGAFGHEACLAFLPDAEPVAHDSFAAAVAAAEAGLADFAIVPVENSIAGPVPGNADLIARPGLKVLARHSLPVRMHLLGVPGARLQEIVRAYSHPMALKQCAGTLKALGIAPLEGTNTAIAAQMLAESGDRTSAVLASEAAAKAYGLTIVRPDMHDRPDNYTVFAVLGRAQDTGEVQASAGRVTATR